METNPINSSSSSSSSISPLPLQDRVAIVTGASRGIGKGIALHLASLGARLVINYTSDSSQSLANNLVTQINNHHAPPRAVAVKADISDPTQVTTLFDTAETTFNSPPHIVVTSAGILDTAYPSIPDTAVSDFDRIFAVNTRGTFLCIQEAAKRIKRGGGGRIVTVSTSLAGVFRPGYGVYIASKAAVEAMTKVVAKELKGTGITANSVAPGPVETEMFYEGKTEEMIRKAVEENPMGRLGKVEDVAPVVGFLVSDAGGWVNGQVIRVNGGILLSYRLIYCNEKIVW